MSVIIRLGACRLPQANIYKLIRENVFTLFFISVIYDHSDKVNYSVRIIEVSKDYGADLKR